MAGISGIMAKVGTSVAKVTSEVVKRFEKVKLNDRRQNQIIISGLSIAVSLSLVYYLSRNRVASPLVTENAEANVKQEEEKEVAEVREVDDDVVGREISVFEPCAHADIALSEALLKTDISTPDTSFTSFETETTDSVSGEMMLTTVDPTFAKGKVVELDKQAKALARKKLYLDAADAISEALELLRSVKGSDKTSQQVASLLNNRSIMYEKGGRLDLALKDCEEMLSVCPSHARAQKRQMRLMKSSCEKSVVVVGPSTRPNFLNRLKLGRVQPKRLSMRKSGQ